MFDLPPPERSLKRKASSDDSDWGQRYPSSGDTLVDPSSSAWYTTPAAATSNHLHLRTRKRFRDNRPDEDVIHANTLKTLFDGARTENARSKEVAGFEHEWLTGSSADGPATASDMCGTHQQASSNATADTPPTSQYDGAMETEIETETPTIVPKDAKQSNLDKFLGIQRRPTPLAGSYSLIMQAHATSTHERAGSMDLPTPPDTSSHGSNATFISASYGDLRTVFQPLDAPRIPASQDDALTGTDVDMLDTSSPPYESTVVSADSTALDMERQCGLERTWASGNMAGLVNSGGARTVWVGGEVGWV